MKWKVSWLKSMPNQLSEVNETLKFDSKMFNKVSNIKDVSEISVVGSINLFDNQVHTDLTFTGIMFLPCANSNEIGEYPFEFKIQGVLDEDYENVVNFEADYIDLLELAWQKLIVEAPTKFVKNENVNRSGKSWKLISEDEFYAKDEDDIDPRFAVLKDLFKEKKED